MAPSKGPGIFGEGLEGLSLGLPGQETKLQASASRSMDVQVGQPRDVHVCISRRLAWAHAGRMPQMPGTVSQGRPTAMAFPTALVSWSFTQVTLGLRDCRA